MYLKEPATGSTNVKAIISDDEKRTPGEEE